MKRHVPVSKRHIPVPKKTALSVLLALVLVLSSALFTYGPKKSKAVPSWDTIYRKAGLADTMSEAYTYPCTVQFLDVGQGDACLIYDKETDYTVLIDTGPSGSDPVILQAMKKVGSGRIDLLVATHPHADHIGSIPELLGSVTIRSLWMTKTNPSALDDTSLYYLILNRLGTMHLDIEIPPTGRTVKSGRMTITVLGPLRAAEEVNNTSLVLKLTYGSVSFLFPGDAEVEEEQDLLQSGANLRASVLKSGHHGSSSSSSVPFLEAVHPQTAVISCGLNNDYGHPSPETLEAMEQQGIEWYRTDRNGTVVMGTDGTTLVTGAEKTS